MKNIFGSYRKLPPAVRVLLISGGFAVTCCCCTLGFVALSGGGDQARTVTEATAPPATATVVSLPTATENQPTLAPTATATTQATEPKSSAVIPGLAPVDVTLNMKERGFDCTTAERGQLYYTWVCTRENANYTLRVDVFSREINTVDYVSATVLQFVSPDDELAASFLGFVATLPYSGAQPEDARAWVEATLPTLTGEGDVRERPFGGVMFQLYGIPTARILDMGELK